MNLLFVVVPSAIVYDCYRAGHLDGYCVAEPWNSAAALSNNGWVAATTSEIEPQHPEKVLLVLQDFAEKREEEHLRMIAALIEARSCERFDLLRTRIADRELAGFYDSLFESEARHYATYVQMARHFASAESVDRRLQELSQAEAAIIAAGDELPRMHS